MIDKQKQKMLKKTGSWTIALVTLIFILIPALMIIIFLGGDFGKPKFNIGIEFIIAISFVVYAILLTALLYWIQLTWIDIANFIVPVAFVLMCIFLTHPLPSWARALICIPLILIAIPINSFTYWLSDKIMEHSNE